MATETDEIKKQLEEKKIPFSFVALKAGVDKGTVSKIFSGTYKGSQDLIDKVFATVEKILNDEPLTLTEDILKYSEDFEKLLGIGSMSSKFSEDTRINFLLMKRELRSYNESKKQAA